MSEIEIENRLNRAVLRCDCDVRHTRFSLFAELYLLLFIQTCRDQSPICLLFTHTKRLSDVYVVLSTVSKCKSLCLIHVTCIEWNNGEKKINSSNLNKLKETSDTLRDTKRNKMPQIFTYLFICSFFLLFFLVCVLMCALYYLSSLLWLSQRHEQCITIDRNVDASIIFLVFVNLCVKTAASLKLSMKCSFWTVSKGVVLCDHCGLTNERDLR